MTNNNFDAAIKVVLEHEGGFVDDPADHGGATNFGITQETLDAYLRNGVPIPAGVRDLTRDEAVDIYRTIYWPPFAGIESAPVAVVMFDQAVLGGPKSAITRMQALLGVKADGEMGPQTVAAINRSGGDELAFRFVRASHHHYAAIVKNEPSQARFIDGWEDRLFSLLDFVFFGNLA